MKERTKRGALKFKRFLSKNRRPIMIGAGILLVINLFAQMIFPTNTAMPFSSMFGEPTGLKGREELVSLLQSDFTGATVDFRVEDRRFSDKLSNYGAKIDADSMASELIDYPLIKRFLPLSIFWHQPKIEKFNVSFREDQITKNIDKISTKLSTEPHDASLKIENGEVRIDPAKDGLVVDKSSVVETIRSSSYKSGNNLVDIKANHIKPKVDDSQIAKVKDEAESFLNQQVNLDVRGKAIAVSRSDVARWITIAGGNQVDLSRQKVAKYLGSIDSKTKVRPTTTKVTLRDGRETSRKSGKPGLGIDINKTTTSLIEGMKKRDGSPVNIKALDMKLKPPIDYKRTYSSTQAGLTAYVRHQTSDGSIKIAVRQLGGAGMSAYGGAGDSIPAASTYKLFLALRLFKDIKNHDRSWSDSIVGSTLSNCLDRMIVVSANNCAEELIKQYKAKKLDKYLRSQGFSAGTKFFIKDTARTTASDLAKLLIGIENRSKLSGANRTILLDKMKRQVFRKGIPAGSKGVVYDKVGFLWDYNHDAAIVRHPRGKYVLVVMTKGHSFTKIAEITRKIEAILYP